MVEVDISKWGREKTYNWFKTFSNSTYSCNVVMDVTELVKYVKKNKQSFFIDLLYIVCKGLNSIDEMRMRLVDDKVVLYEDINPAFTVLTDSGLFENVRFKNVDNFKDFYKIAKEKIDNAKREVVLEDSNYNPDNCYDEYYITCLPWVNFTQLTHPIPDDISSQCIPRICWGKYVEEDGRFKLTLNICVSHILVDGYPLSKTFIKIQELLDDASRVLSS